MENNAKMVINIAICMQNWEPKKEDGICKLPKVREKWKTGNFDHIRCVEDDDDRVLVKDEEFINKWEMYLFDLSTTKCAGGENDDVEPN